MRRALPFAAFALLASQAAAETCGLYEAIEPGDTLSGIAARCDTTVEALSSANPDVDEFDLTIGGVLRLRPEAPGENARAIYNGLAGLWGEDGLCIGREVIVTLEPERIGFGETICDVGDVKSLGPAIFVRAVQCRSEGEPTEDRTVQITRQPGGAIAYSGMVDLTLDRCTDL